MLVKGSGGIAETETVDLVCVAHEESRNEGSFNHGQKDNHQNSKTAVDDWIEFKKAGRIANNAELQITILWKTEFDLFPFTFFYCYVEQLIDKSIF